VFLRIIFCFIGFASLIPTFCQAQVSVDLSISKNDALLYDSIIASVRIQNYSNADVILKDVDGAPWLNFDVTPKSGMRLPVAHLPEMEPIIIGANQEAVRSIDLTSAYAIRSEGGYGITARIILPDGRSTLSRPKRIGVSEGTVLWNQESPVFNDKGEEVVREFTLIEYPRLSTPSLYVRVTDPSSSTILSTLKLGLLMHRKNIDARFDGVGFLHVLFKTGPRTYLWSVVNREGKQSEPKYFSNYGSNPRFTVEPNLSVAIAGGEFLDPNVPVSKSLPKLVVPPKKKKK